MYSPKDLTGPINTGNPTEITIRGLAEMAIDMTRSKSKITFLPLPQDDPKQRQPDIAIVKEHLKWGNHRHLEGRPPAHDWVLRQDAVSAVEFSYLRV